MARTKDESLHQKRKLQILEAAASVFRAKGFHAARTEEICAAAGLSAGTVFRYFRNKEEIIANIAEMEFEASLGMVRGLLSRQGFSVLASIDGVSLEALWAPPSMGLGLDSWLELYRSDNYAAICKEMDASIKTQLMEALRQGQQEGWVRTELDPQGAARIIMALFTGILVEQQLAPELGFDDMAAGLRELLRAYVLKEG
jgi:AcrR family transcriptional regulator